MNSPDMLGSLLRLLYTQITEDAVMKSNAKPQFKKKKRENFIRTLRPPDYKEECFHHEFWGQGKLA